jgi:hypothetical protein
MQKKCIYPSFVEIEVDIYMLMVYLILRRKPQDENSSHRGIYISSDHGRSSDFASSYSLAFPSNDSGIIRFRPHYGSGGCYGFSPYSLLIIINHKNSYSVIASLALQVRPDNTQLHFEASSFLIPWYYGKLWFTMVEFTNFEHKFHLISVHPYNCAFFIFLLHVISYSLVGPMIDMLLSKKPQLLIPSVAHSL